MQEGTRPLLRRSVLWGLEEVHEHQIFLVKGVPLIEIRSILVAPSVAKPKVTLNARAEKILEMLQTTLAWHVCFLKNVLGLGLARHVLSLKKVPGPGLALARRGLARGGLA